MPTPERITSHRRPPGARTRTLLAMAIVAAACVAAAPASGAAQDSLDARSAALVRDKYLTDLDTLHAKFMALAEAIPADKYDWRPSTSVRTVSQVLMHVASEWYYYVPRSIGGTGPADFGTPKETLPKLETITAKADVIAQLNKSWAHCQAQVSAANPAALVGKYKPWNVSLPEASFAMAGDLHEHLGQLIAYARSVGVVPPWSK